MEKSVVFRDDCHAFNSVSSNTSMQCDGVQFVSFLVCGFRSCSKRERNLERMANLLPLWLSLKFIRAKCPATFMVFLLPFLERRLPLFASNALHLYFHSISISHRGLNRGPWFRFRLGSVLGGEVVTPACVVCISSVSPKLHSFANGHAMPNKRSKKM